MCPVASEDGDFLLVDKPLDWTSFDVVAKVRNAYTRAGLKRKVGHCGTLDPKATGLLILAAGRHTKKIAELELLDKGYEGCIKLGVQTVSHDTESEEFGHTSLTHITPEAITAQARRCRVCICSSRRCILPCGIMVSGFMSLPEKGITWLSASLAK